MYNIKKKVNKNKKQKKLLIGHIVQLVTQEQVSKLSTSC